MFDLFRSRDKAVRILLSVILGVVALSMVTYLIPGSGGAGLAADDSVLARVGDEKISTQTALQAVSAQMRGRQLPPAYLGFLAPQIVQQLINDRAMAYEATRLGIRVSDDDVATAVRAQLPAQFFDKDGKVNQDMVSSVLAQNNVTLPQFIEEQRRGLLVSRLRSLVMGSIVVTKADAEREYKHKNEKVKIEYAAIKPAMFEQQVQVTPADVQNYYNKNKASFQTPEQKNLAIVILDSAKIEQGIVPSDSDLHSLYNSTIARFRTTERVKVRHILLKTDAAKHDDAQVEAKAQDLLKQLKGGADFGDLAKKFSQDPGSGAKGGELDFVTRGQTVKPFEDAAFSLKPGEMSGLVKTVYGYHILQVEQKEDARVKPFEEVKEQLIGESRTRAGRQRLQSLADKVRVDLLKDPSHPDKAAADGNGQLIPALNVKTGDPIPGIGPSNELQTAIGALKKNGVTQPVGLPANRVAIAVVTDVMPAHPASLDEVRVQIESTVRRQKIDDLVLQRANDLAAKTKANGGDLEKASKDLGLEVKTSQDFDRAGAVEGLGSASSLSEAFTAKDGAVLGPINSADGKAVAKVISHTPADLAAFPAQEAALRDELKNKIGVDRMALFQAGVRKDLEKSGKVKIQQDALNRLLQGFRS